VTARRQKDALAIAQALVRALNDSDATSNDNERPIDEEAIRARARRKAEQMRKARQSPDALCDVVPARAKPALGVVYALALIPDVKPDRIKVGFTTRSAEHRASDHRTASPTATVLGSWPACAVDERRVHGVLPGRIGTSEVFDVGDVGAALRLIAETIGGEP
jgi:hypothetical protein